MRIYTRATHPAVVDIKRHHHVIVLDPRQLTVKTDVLYEELRNQFWAGIKEMSLEKSGYMTVTVDPRLWSNLDEFSTQLSILLRRINGE